MKYLMFLIDSILPYLKIYTNNDLPVYNNICVVDYFIILNINVFPKD